MGIHDVVQRGIAGEGARLRINTRLLDARAGRLLWTDRVDVSPAALRQTQDGIVLRLANALDAELVLADSQRAAQTAPAS